MLGSLFYALRSLEVWLHQHIFKVGWLSTRQYQTTTILYYAFFLPGIVLNQFLFWLAAGFLNVRAERSIVWPQKQEIGELKLDFIRLQKNVDPLRLAIIHTMPLLVGMVVVWHIANNIIAVPVFLVALGGNQFLDQLGPALGHFSRIPDLWLWVYLAFTISNTMMPNFEAMRGWRVALIAVGIGIVILYIVGAGNQVILNNLRGPVNDALNSLSTLFAIIIGIDVFVVAVLGTIEALIERFTGYSATFKDGKMMTMTRAEMLAQRSKALAPTAKASKAATRAEPAGAPSIYKLVFPIPGPPGKEPVSREENLVIEPPSKPMLPGSEGRSGPAIISGNVTEKLPPPSSDTAPAKPSLGSGVISRPAPMLSPTPKADDKSPTHPPVSPLPNRPPGDAAKPSPVTTSPAPQRATTNPLRSPLDDEDDEDDKQVARPASSTPLNRPGISPPAAAPKPSLPSSPAAPQRSSLTDLRSPLDDEPMARPQSTALPNRPVTTTKPSASTPQRSSLNDLRSPISDDDEDDELTYEDAEDSV